MNLFYCEFKFKTRNVTLCNAPYNDFDPGL